MRLSPGQTAVAAVIAVLTGSTPVLAQTHSDCNPLLAGNCSPDPALGKSVNIDFTQGPSDSFTARGKPTYDSNGASFTIAAPGDSPLLTSNWYIMFGRVEFVMKAAPGAGIVSSAVLISDDLDEIDWEWLGADNAQVQSNYFGKGQTTTYNRGAFHSNPNNQGGFHKYTIDWTSNQVVWQIDGVTVRTLEPKNTQGQYPQTPMQIKIGTWAGGDPNYNAPGTVQWAGGPTNYGAGPFVMQVKSIAVTDYSTGTSYRYGDTSGTWGSIQADGGKVNPGGGSGAVVAGASAPAVTSTSNSAPMPFEGTHRDTSSTYIQPNVYPWVASATTLQTSTVTATTYPGLPSGWLVTSSGKVVPPSAASQSFQPASSTLASPASPLISAAAGDLETVTRYDQQGFPTVVVEPKGASTAPKSYDQQGFLITAAPTPTAATVSTAAAAQLADTVQSANLQIRRTTSAGIANHKNIARGLGAACGILGGALIF